MIPGGSRASGRAVALVLLVLGVAACAARTTALHSTAPSTFDAQPAPATSTQPVSTTTSPTARKELQLLLIAPETHQDSYDRGAEFGGWTSQNGCQDTRAVLLVRTSGVPVTFTSTHDCTVSTGRWTDPWSGISTTIAHDVQLDHTVPLDNAWVSGAWSWTDARRVAYANDLVDVDHLVAILTSENESKGADGPDQWRPPDRATWCRYALVWDHIKVKWHLSATPTEWRAIVAMAASC